MKKVITILVIIVILVPISYGAYTFYKINNNPQSLFETETGETTLKETISIPSEPATQIESPKEDSLTNQEESYKFPEDRVNILLLGLDASRQRYKSMKTFRTDTIMLVSVDFKNEEVYVISIPRDSYVEIPGQKEREKINAAFTRGGGFNGKGFEKTIETVSEFLGKIPIKYYAAVDMDVVKEIIDIMGGLDFEVDIPVKMCGRELKPGMQHLTGQQVLDYARTRHTRMGDIDRIDRQQRIVLAIFNQLKSTKQITKIPEIYKAVKDKVYTNMNIKQIAALAVFASKLEPEKIHRYTIPGGFLNIDGISYWGIDQYKKRDLIEEIFGIKIEINPKDDINYIKSELEKKKKALAAATDEANKLVNITREALNTYFNVVKEAEKTEIENLIKEVERACEEGDIIAIKNASSSLNEVYKKLLPVFEDRQKAFDSALSVIKETEAKSKQYAPYMNEDEKNTLDNAVNQVNEALAKLDIQSITSAVTKLNECAENIFRTCEERKKEEIRKATIESLNEAIKTAQNLIDSINQKVEEYTTEQLTEQQRQQINQEIASVQETINNAQNVTEIEDIKAVTDEIKQKTAKLQELTAKIFEEADEKKESSSSAATSN